MICEQKIKFTEGTSIFGVYSKKVTLGRRKAELWTKHESCKHIHVIDMFKMDSMVNHSGQVVARISHVVKLITTANCRLPNPEALNLVTLLISADVE
jgi:hypothetical protein